MIHTDTILLPLLIFVQGAPVLFKFLIFFFSFPGGWVLFLFFSMNRRNICRGPRWEFTGQVAACDCHTERAPPPPLFFWQNVSFYLRLCWWGGKGRWRCVRVYERIAIKILMEASFLTRPQWAALASLPWHVSLLPCCRLNLHCAQTVVRRCWSIFYFIFF